MLSQDPTAGRQSVADQIVVERDHGLVRLLHFRQGQDERKNL